MNVPMMTLAQVQALLPQARLVGDPNVGIFRVHTDSRTLQPGDLFVALGGENFDGHAFLSQARSAGAVAVLASREVAACGLPGLEVADTRRALGLLAQAWRAKFDLPFIAVTGSNGKTTVTQMLASVLRAWEGEAAFATLGNLNNDVGVPLTLLRLRQNSGVWHKAGVVELGMNHPGEIAELAAMAAPTVALVNNAQREHQEFMITVEAVARENGCVFSALASDGVAVFPADDLYTDLWRTLAGARKCMTFALQGKADVTADVKWAIDHWALMLHTPVGAYAVKLRIAGLHNVKNALAVTACALAAGCPVEAVVLGLEAFSAVKGRSQLKSAHLQGAAITLIDDTYNANPDSVRAAIDVLAQLPGPRWLVLGDMGEVGAQGPEFHREVGAYAMACGIEHLWLAGSLCTYAAQAFVGARHFATVPELLAALPQAPRAVSMLAKGSRFMQMERVVAALVAAG
jgi:UDP-N-acetylmuramoyl-tripeptide--D-alanyl-D-alanine ligase